jgi:hypothetical protein
LVKPKRCVAAAKRGKCGAGCPGRRRAAGASLILPKRLYVSLNRAGRAWRGASVSAESDVAKRVIARPSAGGYASPRALARLAASLTDSRPAGWAPLAAFIVGGLPVVAFTNLGLGHSILRRFQRLLPCVARARGVLAIAVRVSPAQPAWGGRRRVPRPSLFVEWPRPGDHALSHFEMLIVGTTLLFFVALTRHRLVRHVFRQEAAADHHRLDIDRRGVEFRQVVASRSRQPRRPLNWRAPASPGKSYLESARFQSPVKPKR